MQCKIEENGSDLKSKLVNIGPQKNISNNVLTHLEPVTKQTLQWPYLLGNQSDFTTSHQHYGFVSCSRLHIDV